MLTTLLLTMITATETTAEQAENLSVVAHLENYNDKMLFEHIMNIANAQYQKRDEALSQLKTVEDWKQRREYVRKKLLEMIGGFPERTPLHPRIDGGCRRVDSAKETGATEHLRPSPTAGSASGY